MNKSIRKLIYILLFFGGIFLFPALWIFFIVAIVITLMFDSAGSNGTKKTNIKETTKNTGYYIKQANTFRDAWQGIKPRTFYEVMGDLAGYTWLYYSEELYNLSLIHI